MCIIMCEPYEFMFVDKNKKYKDHSALITSKNAQNLSNNLKKKSK